MRNPLTLRSKQPVVQTPANRSTPVDLTPHSCLHPPRTMIPQPSARCPCLPSVCTSVGIKIANIHTSRCRTCTFSPCVNGPQTMPLPHVATQFSLCFQKSTVLCCCHLQLSPPTDTYPSMSGLVKGDRDVRQLHDLEAQQTGKKGKLSCVVVARERSRERTSTLDLLQHRRYTLNPPFPLPHGCPIRPLFQPDFGPDTAACPFHTYARRYIYTFTPSTLPRARRKKSGIAPRVEFLITRHASP